MTSNNPSLASLAATISEAATALTALLDKNGLPAPSFAEDGLEDYPKLPELMGPRLQLLDAAADMFRLALGPNDFSFMNPLFLNFDASIMDIFNQFGFWTAVPLGGSATYSEIAKKVNLPESLVRRLLKYGLAIRVFAPAPDAPDSIVHTSLSAAPAKNQLLSSWIRHNFEEMRPATLHFPEAFSKFSAGKDKPSDEVLESAFSLANVDKLDQLESFWDYMVREVEGKPKGYRATKFAESMQAAASASAVKSEEVLKSGYDWSKLGGATVVDVGGSSGHDAVHLANNFPNVKIVVQDLPKVEESFNTKVPDELKSRISFKPHDFFQPQETKGDVYMLKMILHDWPDKDAAKILKGLLPQLTPEKSRVLLFEVVAPPQGAQLPFQTLNRLGASSDLQMLGSCNSLERTEQNWRDLVKGVDERLEITSVSQLPGAFQSVIEIKLNGSI
ncbi:putative O-methyltransferase [Mariannaea sp. PMI_226]|nr:putative O-methyltransferase [Mariannaea sp. PMI_226]